jgi:hypothetical protein
MSDGDSELDGDDGDEKLYLPKEAIGSSRRARLEFLTVSAAYYRRIETVMSLDRVEALIRGDA